jgi:riboflavin synthase alpha subunit
LINNSKIWMIIVIPLAIMIVIFGYLAYQMNGISVTLNAVLEQNLSLYEIKTTEISFIMRKKKTSDGFEDD